MFIIYCGHRLHPYYHQTDAVLRLQPFVLALRIIGEVCIYYRHMWNRLSIEAPVQCQVRNCRYHPSIFVFVTFPVGFCWVKSWVSIARRNSRDRRSSGSSNVADKDPNIGHWPGNFVKFCRFIGNGWGFCESYWNYHCSVFCKNM